MATTISWKASADSLVKLFKDHKSWDAWLDKHAESSPGLWLRLAKKSAKLKSVTYGEALEAALCHGWIDGQRKTFDAESFIQKFTPRRPKSIWSRINRTKALELIEAGRMRPSGHAAIEKARQSGLWEAAYDSHRTAVVPEDLAAALEQSPKAKTFFETLNKQNRYAILFRIQTAKKSETRKRRIEDFVAMLEVQRKLYP
jgi:uncharacterized protein YdeI (YjbR/CyaY-like superfamily)